MPSAPWWHTDPTERNETPLTPTYATDESPIGVVLAQVGTPGRLDTKEIRRYLGEFLSDERIVDLPRWRWKPILHGIVLRVRPRHVKKFYGEIWTDEGSPLLVTSRAQRDGVQQRLGDGFRVELGLAYSKPGIAAAMERLEHDGIHRIVAVPLFPQFATTTTAAVYDATMLAALGRGKRGKPVKKYSPTLRFVHPFYDDPDYITVLADSVDRQLQAMTPQPDRIIVSFHGMPVSYVDEGDPYPEHCAATTRLLAERLGWGPDDYEFAYQSRFGRAEWLQPYL